MSETLRCDNCRKVTETEGMVGWVEVRPIGVEFTVVSERPRRVQHFCSARCLAESASEKAAK